MKPPIGVLNRKTYELFLSDRIKENGGMSLVVIKKTRLNDLRGAIERYTEANRIINIEWVTEYNELLSSFGVKDIKFSLK